MKASAKVKDLLRDIRREEDGHDKPRHGKKDESNTARPPKRRPQNRRDSDGVVDTKRYAEARYDVYLLRSPQGCTLEIKHNAVDAHALMKTYLSVDLYGRRGDVLTLLHRKRPYWSTFTRKDTFRNKPKGVQSLLAEPTDKEVEAVEQGSILSPTAKLDTSVSIL